MIESGLGLFLLVSTSMFEVTVPDTMFHQNIIKYAAGPQMKKDILPRVPVLSYVCQHDFGVSGLVAWPWLHHVTCFASHTHSARWNANKFRPHHLSFTFTVWRCFPFHVCYSGWKSGVPQLPVRASIILTKRFLVAHLIYIYSTSGQNLLPLVHRKQIYMYYIDDTY